MAWQAFDISGIDYTYTPVNTNIYTQLVNVPSDRYNNIEQIITDITWVEKTSLHDVTLVSKDGYTITCNSLDSGRELSIRFTKPNEEYVTIGGGRYLRGTTYVTFGFFIDDENEVATFAPYATNYDNATRWQSGTNLGRLINSNWLYTFFKAIEPIHLVWTPVSSVYGKLGTINLSKLKDINDGEPVTGASSSAVNLTDKSLISILVGNVIVDDNKVGVEYSIPSGTYEYIKLVYKQDSEPEDASDGTAIDLEIGDGVIGISGINDGNTYFFKIFTDINASQAYEFTTEKPVVPPEYQSYIDIINGSGFWWKNYPNKNYYNANQAGLAIYPPTLLSWISNYDDYSYNFTPTAARSQYCYVSNIQDVYITSNNNVYSVNHTISGSQQAFLYDNNPGWLGNVFTNQTFATMYIGQNPDGTTLSTSGTLAQVLSWMSYRFRNINIYVDNVCWSKVN